MVFDSTGVADGLPAAGLVASHHVVARITLFIGTRRLLVYSAADSVLTNGVVIEMFQHLCGDQKAGVNPVCH